MLRVYPAVLLLIILLVSPVHQGHANQLAGHPSPYLAMHGQDPVHWQTWGKAAQQAAIKQNKLLYVSSGYFSCHWCHVMQRESYANTEIAKLLNENFIPVKVDRELNPALDALLIDFVERTRGFAGWPLNVFITPEGYPLLGMVYLPPDNFKKVLANLAHEWQTNQQDLKQLAKAVSAELSADQVDSHSRVAVDAAPQYMKLLVKQALQQGDDLQGGFGQQNKFPSVPQLMVLLQAYQRKPDKQLADFLELTLDQMASQGLNDQLGGGFFRYTVDPAWQIPHFEKMLYDNALLAQLYLQAARVLQRDEYRIVGFRTLDFMLQELATPEGAFAASLSALDDQGVEGGYYLWREEDLRHYLSDSEWQVARLVWGLQGKPELEAGYHLVQHQDLPEVARQLNLPLSEIETSLASAQAKLLAKRKQRQIPIDTKTVAAWNGLTLSALALAVQAKGGDVYRAAGVRLRNYLATVVWRDGQLQRAVSQRSQLGQAGLEDYAYVATGLLDWSAVSDKPEADIALANAIVTQAWQRFYQPPNWLLAEDMWLRYGAGETVVADSAMPSPSAILIDTSLRLAGQTGDKVMAANSRRALQAGGAKISTEPFWYASQIGALQQLTQ
jgi:uncharacterized protein YyaL (SSP411 family)